jgi:hypothetical protein
MGVILEHDSETVETVEVIMVMFYLITIIVGVRGCFFVSFHYKKRRAKRYYYARVICFIALLLVTIMQFFARLKILNQIFHDIMQDQDQDDEDSQLEDQQFAFLINLFQSISLIISSFIYLLWIIFQFYATYLSFCIWKHLSQNYIDKKKTN